MWNVEFHPDFFSEFKTYSEIVQNNILAKSLFVQEYGPVLGRPHVDTLKDSIHANMKELRLEVDEGVWRIAFAFDPKRNAILLIAGDKKGKDQKNSIKNSSKKQINGLAITWKH